MPEKKSPRPSSGTGPDSPAGSSGLFSLLGTASTMGLHMVSGPIVGCALGWLADKWFDSWPVGAAVGLLLGVAAGFRNVWVDARYLIREQEKTSGDGGSKEPTAQEPGQKGASPHSSSGNEQPGDVPSRDERP